MRNRFVTAGVMLVLAAFLGGCSDGQFVFAPAKTQTPVSRPIQQSSGDGAGMSAFSPRSEDQSSREQEAAVNTVNASMIR